MVGFAFPPWVLELLLIGGICALFSTNGLGVKIFGGVMTFLSGLMLAVQIWVRFRR